MHDRPNPVFLDTKMKVLFVTIGSLFSTGIIETAVPLAG